jgi:hypothetical protein
VAEQTSKKAAAKKSTSSDKGSGDDEQARDEARQVPNPAGNSGAGTGQEAPPEDTARMPAETVNTDPDAAPLDPPADAHTQTEPEHGYAASSTDHTYAAAGGRTIAGEAHVRLVDADDNELSADELFDESDTTKTYVTAKTRVYEVFTYPNSSREAKRLLFAEGKRVPRFQAERIKTQASAGV